MVITSLHGTFSIIASEKDQDQLFVRSNEKKELSNVFGEKRVLDYEGESFDFFVPICKQEFANTLIMMVKEVNYSDLAKELQEIKSSSENIYA
ncbi:hypothetical protein [Rhodonellum sp.]|uniref:hypothetical protein n=1 Tax=Rhodonellum sp. TaxID=2231180 RepID=UPI00271F4548|nr:hypothetical protein [Rhodonellum sp.]MDO9552800.1 hypothetical protein [Rhodonellum sp.]